MPAGRAGHLDAVDIDDQTRVVKYQPLYARVTEDSGALHCTLRNCGERRPGPPGGAAVPREKY